MKGYIGIDLGSTTTKAVLMDEDQKILGRGITNSRSNYDTATRVAKQEAVIDTRLTLCRRELSGMASFKGRLDDFLGGLERSFRLEQFLEQLGDLEDTCRSQIKGERFAKVADGIKTALGETFERLRAEAPALFTPEAKRKSDFFRDIAGSRYLTVAEAVAKDAELPYDLLINVYDKSIIEVENRPPSQDLTGKFMRALNKVIADAPEFGVDVKVGFRVIGPHHQSIMIDT